MVEGMTSSVYPVYWGPSFSGRQHVPGPKTALSKMSETVYTWEEVAQHVSPGDCTLGSLTS
jgi:hypothetical protein